MTTPESVQNILKENLQKHLFPSKPKEVAKTSRPWVRHPIEDENNLGLEMLYEAEQIEVLIYDENVPLVPCSPKKKHKLTQVIE